ncbi:MAG TPA: pyridoxal phosphate-dependent aminotransferase [Spirochaetia bacterium]|nr:pyridoxal phosphate-dependent aminotransferase [Spirochaetia bacterium]
MAAQHDEQTRSREIRKSKKLEGVCYDIRGPVLARARQLEEEGFKVLKLNIGNPAPFGFDAPDEIIHDVIINLHNAQGYCDSKGLFSARKAIMQHYQEKGLMSVGIDDIYIGNGVSELIVMAMQGLLNDSDEMLVPAPDYPLWTAAVNLAGGRTVHYRCDEQSDWVPDLEDIEKKISPRTKGIVVINPNNPTGAVYPKEVLTKIAELAAQHGLIVFADEIYDKILYDEEQHWPMSTLCADAMTVTFNGLSKAYRAAGFRAGWMVLSGKRNHAKDYLEGLEMLSNMRLCSNVPSQFAIQTALGGYQSINDLVRPGGRLREQRDFCYNLLVDIPGVTCVKPRGALYMFPKLDVERFGITNDEQFVLDFLMERKILLVHGTGFNWFDPDHFRIVFLPIKEELGQAMNALRGFLQHYHQNG